MNRFVVDASVAVKWIIPEPHSDLALSLLEKSPQMLAPDLFICEITNVLWKRSRRGDFTPQFAQSALSAIQALPIILYPASPLAEPALELALTLGCTVYDALYLVLAVGQGCEFVTADRKFYETMAGKTPAGHLCWVEDAARKTSHKK